MDDEKVLVLRKPVSMGGKEGVNITELHLREPTAGELDTASRVPGSNVTQAIKLISLVSKVPVKAIEQISQRDLAEASDFLGSFVDPSNGSESTPGSPSEA